MFLLDCLFLVTLAFSRLIESTQRLNVEKAKPKAHCGGDIGVVRSNKHPLSFVSSDNGSFNKLLLCHPTYNCEENVVENQRRIDQEHNGPPGHRCC